MDSELNRWVNMNIPNDSMTACLAMGLDTDAIERAAKFPERSFQAEHFRIQAGYGRSSLKASDQRSRAQIAAAERNRRPLHGGYPDYEPEEYDGA